MTFTGVTFFIFLPISIIIYFLCPKRFRYIWLLIISYFFYTTQSQAFTAQLVISTAITWITGGLAATLRGKSQKKLAVALGVILNISMLAFFKYTNFFLSVVGSDKSLSIILPAGISFYTFQSITYVIDCYRGDCEPERNFLKYALFVSFFPLILSGPIERAKNLLPQFDCNVDFDTDRAKDGLKLMLFGYFCKMVIVARLAILTDHVLNDYRNQTSVALIIAVLAYAFQIYCDFAGYSSIAIGMSRIMGFNIMRNFRQPYLATSVADFWRRWHISLSSWFRDYLYIPLGGNRKGTFRKYINIMIVFILSGIWHGANLTFIVWGFLNGLYQVIGGLCAPIKKSIKSWFIKHLPGRQGVFVGSDPQMGTDPKMGSDIDMGSDTFDIMSTIVTFILLDFTWIFFRANSIPEAFEIIHGILTRFNFLNLIDGTIFTLGLGKANLLFVIVAVIILILTDVICEKKNCDVTGLLVNTPTIIRWGVYYLLIAMIILSCNLSTQEFIYQQF